MNPPHSPGAALREAASLGDAALCQRLLGSARGCVRYSRDGLGRSALHLASAGGHAAALRILLDAAAPGEVDRPDGEGCAPLQRAASDGQEECERLLLSRGADVDKRDAVHGNTALHEAAWKGYSRSVRLLAMAGATLDLTNGGGFTALHLCCQNGHNQTCRELLLAGCNPDIQNSYGDTSLHTAARYGHAGVTRILLSANCQVSVANKNGDTALHIASAMGRRKLTRILMEAGCERGVRNQQGETARDIAARKGLAEIVGILDRVGGVKGKGRKGRGKSKVRFEPDVDVGALPLPTIIGTPYGCHYSPSPSSFPPPRLDTLPSAPLRRGEQYYLDLAGRIRKGPVGVGAACRCAPLLKQLEARLSREGRELRAVQAGLGARVRGLEERLARTGRGRRSERTTRRRETCLVRSRSLEAVDEVEDGALQASRSMDELDPPDTQSSQRQSVKEIVAKFQQQTYHNGENSESSDDEDNPLRICKIRGPMGDSNLSTNPFPIPNYENIPNDSPRSRSGVYNPTTINTALVQPTTLHLHSGKPQDSDMKVFSSEGYVRFNTQPSQKRDQDLRYDQNLHSAQQKDLGYDVNYNRAFESSRNENSRVVELNSRFAKLRVLEGTRSALEGTSRMLDTNKMFDSTVRMLETPQDTGDRDTNNDSGYSTKVYGSSKGNSPSLSGGQVEGECVGAASLV